VKVGFVVPYSGGVADYGKDADEAWTLAAEKYGKTVNGHKIELTKYDDQCVPSAAVSAVKKALGDGVQALIGPTCSGNVLAVKDMVRARKVPLITQAYAPEITSDGGGYIFRMPPSDAVLNGNLAKYLVAQGWNNQVAIVHDGTGFGQAEGKTITDGYKAQHVDPIVDITYKTGATDFSGEIQKLKSVGAKTACLMGYDPDTARMAVQMQQLGLTINLCGGQENGYADSLDVAKGALDGMLYYSVFQPDAQRFKSFNDAWKAKYGKNANPEQWEYYLSAVTLIQAVKSIDGKVTADGLNKAITKLHFDVEGATTLAFTNTGDPKCGTVLVATNKNNQAVTIKDDTEKC